MIDDQGKENDEREQGQSKKKKKRQKKPSVLMPGEGNLSRF
jgi:hypothetical protein